VCKRILNKSNKIIHDNYFEILLYCICIIEVFNDGNKCYFYAVFLLIIYEKMKNWLNTLTMFVFLFLFIVSSQAQQEVSVSRKDFKSDKQGFSQAWKFIKDGDSFYSEQGVWYKSALQDYLQAYSYNSRNAELNYKMGVCCLYSDKKEEAIDFFLKAGEIDNNVATDLYLLTGRAFQFSGRFLEAIGKYTEYLNLEVKKPEENIVITNKYIDECNAALLITKDTLRIELVNPGNNINSEADDYSPVIRRDGQQLFLASRKQYFSRATSYKDTKYDENIFVTDLKNGQWDVALSVGKDVNTKYSEAPLYVNAGGDQLFIYAGYEGGGDIKVSYLKKGKWRTPESENYGINGTDSETSFNISPSGNEIYFVSDRKKNSQGGKDIFVISRLNNKKWSKPVNLGPVINTKFDEESPRMSNDGTTLFFSSRGHNSIGGFDVFYSVRDSAGIWSKPVNAGYPVNSVWDELYYCPLPVNDSTFYLATNRSGGLGGLDIYEGHILPPVRVIPEVKKDTVVYVRDTVFVVKEVVPVIVPEPVKETGIYLTGRVIDSESGKSLVAKMEIVDLEIDQVVSTSISSEIDGTYRIKLPEKKSYMVDVRSDGYLSEMKRINITASYVGTNYNFDIPLNKIQVGKRVVLNNILFESGKAVLTSGSYIELNRLVAILTDSKLMKIEISGHTDNTGSEVINAKLSNDRAKAVVEYLVQKGIDRTRLTYKGLGSTQPITNNSTPEGRAKNRRVEFKILEF
jgi:outer membrane protein OmpA-like peptidoglycan-associated protein/tetratricopeptide (TPR) repeat protein